MFEYLAAGKAVIGSVTGEAAQILREAGAVVVPPEDSDALADAIRALAADPESPGGHEPGGPGLRGAVLRPGRAGPRVPQDPRPARARADEAAGDRGQRVPRRLRPRRGRTARAFLRRACALARPLRGRWPRAARRRWPATWTTRPHWPSVFASAGCDALVNLASLGFGHAPAIVGAAVGAGLDRAVFVSTTAVTTTLPARSKAVRLAAEQADPLVRPEAGRSCGRP